MISNDAYVSNLVGVGFGESGMLLESGVLGGLLAQWVKELG